MNEWMSDEEILDQMEKNKGYILLPGNRNPMEIIQVVQNYLERNTKAKTFGNYLFKNLICFSKLFSLHLWYGKNKPCYDSPIDAGL